MFFSQLGQRIKRLLSDNYQFALECVLICAILAPGDDALAHHWHRFDNRLAQTVQRGRYITPTNDALAFLGNELFELFGHEGTCRAVLRHEAHGDSVLAWRGEFLARTVRPIAKQRIGNLQQNTRAVPQKRVSAYSTAVIDIVQDFERLCNNRVRFHTFDMRDHTDAAGVVFIPWIVQPLWRRVSHSFQLLTSVFSADQAIFSPITNSAATRT